MVDKREKLMNSFNQYGFLTFKQVIDENLHYKTLLKMVTEGKIDAEEIKAKLEEAGASVTLK
ncbi:Tn5253 hypothetical protein [Streptococcus pneumoniae]|nr:Tn5253 hypothetical protein [Streptococcus pneumoniae]